MRGRLSAGVAGEGLARPAVFLDKDGTLIRNIPWNCDPQRIELLPGVLEGLRELCDRGYALFVISNQPGIAYGHFGEGELQRVWQRLQQLVDVAGVQFEGFYYCPHAPRADGLPACSCHKPRPGLLWRAAVEHNLDLYHSWMVGDILHDVEAGHGAGCRSALLDNGGETEWLIAPARVPDVIAHDFTGVVRLMDDKPVVRRSRRHRQQLARQWW